jgi:hypothetical protein
VGVATADPPAEAARALACPPGWELANTCPQIDILNTTTTTAGTLMNLRDMTFSS